MDIASLGNQWYFWLILIVIIAFIIYSGLKKRKKETKERKKREKEVKNLIKTHLRENDNLSNIVVEYLDVKPRMGKKYKSRDVYDVFVEIKKPRVNQVIAKKAYEIEGFARFKNTQKAKKQNDENVIINWTINKEFYYKEHKNIIEKELPGKFSIFAKSLFKKNRKKYIDKKMQDYAILHNKKEEIHNNNKEEENSEVFRPEFEKKDEKF